MPDPSVAQLHVSQVLTNFAMEYMQLDGFVGEFLAPFIKADHETDKYDIYGKEALMLLETEVAPTALPPLFEFTLSQGTFTIDYHRLSALVEWGKRKGASGSLGSNDGLKKKNVEGITRIMKLGHEYRVMDACVGAATTFSTVTLAGNDQWNSGHADAKPIDDVKTAKQTIRTGCQKDANVMVIPINVLEELQLNAQIQSYISYNNPDMKGHAHTVTEEILEGLFGIDNVLIAKAQWIDASLDAVGSTTPDYIWGKNCFIGYVDPAVVPGMMCALKTFVFPWVGEGLDPVVRDIPEDKYLWDFLDILWPYVIKVTATGAGYAIKSCIS